MKKESYLSEEKYQQSKNKISQIAKTILIIGVCLGAFLIIMGIIKINKNASNQDNNQTEISVVDLKSQVDALEEDLIPLQAQKSTEFKSNGFSELYYRLDKEIKDKKEEISELESQIWKIESGYNDTFNNANNIRTKAGAMPYFMFGGFIIVASCMVSGRIYMITKKREILAFGMQSVMPVAQEGIEKMTPTITKVGKKMAPVYGEIAKEISKGIKDGINNESNDDK